MWRNQNFFNEEFLIENPLDPWSTLAVPFPALITPLPVNILLNRLAPKVSNSTDKKQPGCCLASFLIISIASSAIIPESSRDLTIFKMSY